MPFPPNNIPRRTALKLVAGQVALVAGQVAATRPSRAFEALPKTKTSPNVILVLLDDLGYGDLACLGNPVIKTPNIDRLYELSIRFTDFHVSPTCSPTRASLMTGRYCNATGVWHTIEGRSLLNPINVTLAHCFKSSGYSTGIYGKWHLGDNYPSRPIDLGFDDSIVCGGGGISHAPDYFENDDIDDTYIHNGKWQQYKGFSTDVFFEQAMAFMSQSQRKHQPFFCYLATTAPHGPWWAMQKDTEPYVGVQGLDAPGFYGMIANIDTNMGRLMRFLEANRLSDDTILIFSSDNGTTAGQNVFNASMRGMKGSPYDGGHRTPLFVYWPSGGLTGGRDVPNLAAHIDILPTLVELCNLENRGRDVDGRSLCPLLLNQSDSEWPDRTIVTDSQRLEFLHKWKETAVMTQRWRLVSPTVEGDATKLELYDMTKDPGQSVDVGQQHPDVVKFLAAQYKEWWRRVSADGGEYVRIGVGSDRESPTFLSSHNWHGEDQADKAWNQGQIRQANIANGVWTLEIERAGQYRFELRRWPREVDLPINAPYANQKPNQQLTLPGIAISAIKARLMIGNIDVSKPVRASDKFVEFVVPLEKGPMELRTSFFEADLTERGAYYVYAERL